jgi:hypothetical protein
VALGALALIWRTGESFAWGEDGRRVFASGSGDIATLEEAFTGFDRVAVSHSFEVEIKQSDRFRTVIRVDEDLVDYVEVVKRGNILSIGLKQGLRYQINNVTMHAEVTMPSLNGLSLSGASQASITGFESLGEFRADMSGASSLKGDLVAGEVRFGVSGASRLTLRGTAGELALVASGASRVRLSEFRVTDSRVEASGASDVTIHASGRLDAEASGVSRIAYLGDPSLGRVETSFGSSITPR